MAVNEMLVGGTGWAYINADVWHPADYASKANPAVEHFELHWDENGIPHHTGRRQVMTREEALASERFACQECGGLSRLDAFNVWMSGGDVRATGRWTCGACQAKAAA